MENLYYLIPFFIILIFISPILFKLRFSYNVIDNFGAVGIFLFGIKIFSFKFDINLKGIKLYTDKGIEEVGYNIKNQEAVLMEMFIKEIKDKTRLKMLQIHYNIGVGDAFQTAMICGVINAIILILFTRIKAVKPTASLFLGDNPAFNESTFQFAGSLKISISLIDIVYSFLNSVILTLKSKNDI